MIREARARGYHIEMVYVGTNDVAINLERIRVRVAAGGHDVPTEDVVRRSKRSFQHAPETVILADDVALFDNSGEQMVAVMFFEDGKLHIFQDPPAWATDIIAALQARVK